jgi:hypothetical protein
MEGQKNSIALRGLRGTTTGRGRFASETNNKEVTLSLEKVRSFSL